MNNSWFAETPHQLNAKGLKAGQSPVGLQQDTRTVLSLLASFHLKSDFMANMTFQLHFLMNP